ncbi:hypothetical protein H0H93_004363, partial [Arthromyces matolae]
ASRNDFWEAVEKLHEAFGGMRSLGGGRTDSMIPHVFTGKVQDILNGHRMSFTEGQTDKVNILVPQGYRSAALELEKTVPKEGNIEFVVEEASSNALPTHASGKISLENKHIEIPYVV